MSPSIALPLPDLPRWVEAHDLARDPASWRREVGGGGCVGRSAGPSPLICVWGDADAAAVAALAAEHPHHTLLIERERQNVVAALRDAGRAVVRAVLSTLPDPDALPDDTGATPLAADVALDHLPGALRAELEAVRAGGAIWAAWVDGVPVSFAYASARSPRWFDVAVETVADARQLGLATRVAAALIRDERGRGVEPVWGATDDNVASARLASRLGFTPVDELWVVPP